MTLLVSNDIVTQEFNSTANAKSEVRANLQIYTFVLWRNKSANKEGLAALFPLI